MYKKEQLQKLGEETVDILKKGKFKTKNKTIDIKDHIENMIDNTKLYRPKDGAKLINELSGNPENQTVFEVVNDTTLSVCRN
ncbi:poly(ADP-ribose) glycohydrolase domain-containing protein [Bacillus mexicanus]|uniref:poly(ADP-ribose) glycohydrolase domain-containing protein n=1 Tax=Bacillus mexicanus TaxID=2834415 RepID=UPI003D224E3F